MKISAKIDKIFDNKESSTKALASVVLDDAFTIHGIKVIENKNGGTFVAMPNRTYTNNDGEKKYSDICHAITKDAHTELTDIVLGAYEKELLDNFEEIDDNEIVQSM